MERVFLDANVFIDLVEQRKIVPVDPLDEKKLFVSPLSIHIVHYLYKYSIPHKKFSTIDTQFSIVDLTKAITLKALNGPTKDFEDNVQLHSAISADCDYFLTLDQKLLTMGYFGSMRIGSSLNRNDKR